jgi:nucleoside-diphosphate-sugar epimerase
LKDPHTKKGKVRVAFEKLIFDPKWSGAQAIIVRLPDYYGPTSQNAYLHPTLTGLAAGKMSIFIGDLHTRREYVYLPDAAKMIVNIALRDDSYGQNWNIPGPGVISGREIIELAMKATGRRQRVLPLSQTAIRLIGIIDPFMREVVEIMYLMKEPFVLSGRKYTERIGPIPATPYHIGIEETMRLGSC